MSRDPNPGPTLVLAPIPAPVLTLAPALPSLDELFRDFMKAYLESNRGPKQPLAEREQLFKAKVSDVYYRKSYMDCYHFYQHYKNYYETVGATRAKRTPFTAVFLCGSISVQWT